MPPHTWGLPLPPGLAFSFENHHFISYDKQMLTKASHLIDSIKEKSENESHYHRGDPKTIPLPPIIGVLAIGGGILLIVAGVRKK